MMRKSLETKKYKVQYLGEFAYDDSFEYIFDRYLVEVKDIECSAIMYEFDQNGVCCMAAWEQNNQTKEGQELTNYTHIIGKLIENDIVDIVGFINKHL
ncbi:hypothetical protein JCM1393_15400 [Clostridium carnis]